MSPQALLCYDYVNHPYAVVRDALLADPEHAFRHATVAAARHATTLHVQLGPIDLGADIAIAIVAIENEHPDEKPVTRMKLVWSAAKHPGLFPAMEATLSVFALSPTETQLELAGRYTPPLGVVGKALDAAVGHRLAEASVKRFIQEVAGWLRAKLPIPIASVPLSNPGALDQARAARIDRAIRRRLTPSAR
jgi:hypothetical protein